MINFAAETDNNIRFFSPLCLRLNIFRTCVHYRISHTYENTSRQNLLCPSHREILSGGGRFPKEDGEVRLWCGYPTGAQRPFGTRSCLQGLVCYTFVPRRAEKVDTAMESIQLFRTQGRRTLCGHKCRQFCKNCLPGRGDKMKKTCAEELRTFLLFWRRRNRGI